MSFMRFILRSVRAKIALMLFSLAALLVLVQSANMYMSAQSRGDADLLNYVYTLRGIVESVSRLAGGALLDPANREAWTGDLAARVETGRALVEYLGAREIAPSGGAPLNLGPVPLSIDPQFLNRSLFERQLDEARIREGIEDVVRAWEECRRTIDAVAAGDTALTVYDVQYACLDVEDRIDALGSSISAISNEKIDRIELVNRLVLVGTVLLSLGFYLSLRRLFVIPVENLRAATERFGRGDRSARADTESADEIGTLARAYNAMIETVLDRERIDRDRLQEIALKNEELLKASRLKSQFLANMSHELRTPMNSIIGYSEVLLDGLDGDLSEEQKEDVRAILRSAEHLLKLINEILDLSKIEAGHMKVEVADVRLRDVVKDVLTVVEPLAAPKGLRLELSIREDDLMVRADRDRVRQVVMNLLSNAVKFTDRGRVTVRLFRDTDFGVVEVEDTGPGIPENELGRIFEEFHQVDGATTRKHGGTGLGLSIARRFVELMGGRLTVRSVLGDGSVFRLALPLVRPRASAPAESAPVLLVVEDDRDAIALFRRHVEKSAVELVPAPTIAEARAWLDAARARGRLPAGVILDIQLPDGDGRSLLRDLKSDPATSSVPVAVLSVSDDDGAAVKAGAVRQSVKPVGRSEFLEIVRILAGEKRP